MVVIVCSMDLEEKKSDYAFHPSWKEKKCHKVNVSFP